MTAESAQKIRELEADRKGAQERLYQQFLSTRMTVQEYENRVRQIDVKFARDEAVIILDAIMQNQ